MGEYKTTRIRYPIHVQAGEIDTYEGASEINRLSTFWQHSLAFTHEIWYGMWRGVYIKWT